MDCSLLFNTHWKTNKGDNRAAGLPPGFLAPMDCSLLFNTHWKTNKGDNRAAGLPPPELGFLAPTIDAAKNRAG